MENRNLGGTAQDFTKWESRARGMTEAELRHTIKDCRRAAMNLPALESWYNDQAFTYADELRRRKISAAL